MENFLFDKGNPQSADEINKLRKKIFLNRKNKATSLEKKVIASAKIRFDPRFLSMSMGRGSNNFTYQPTSSGSNFCKNMDFCINEELYDEIASEGELLDNIKGTIKNEIIKILPVLSKQRERVENVSIDILDSNSWNMNSFELIEPDQEWLAGLDLETEPSTSPDESLQERQAEKTTNSLEKPNVFVVHGHDKDALKDLKILLLEMGVKPTILQEIDSQGDTLIEALEKRIINKEADLVVVLMTPDDATEVNNNGEKKLRARQNVILEMGMAIGAMRRKKVFIIVKGENLELPSDIAGIIYNSYKDNINEVSNKLRDRLKNLGFEVD